MQLSEVQRLLDGGISLRYLRADFREQDGRLIIMGKVALPVYRVPPYTAGGPDISIVEEDATPIGTLCLCTRIQDVDSTSLTDDQYIAYLNDIELDEFGAKHTFRHDYVVLEADRKDYYSLEYETSSGLWGGFVHYSAAFPSPRSSSIATSQIYARKNLAFPTSHHHEGMFRSTQEQFAFERFLKLYHLLELIFDWRIVEKIKALGTDLAGISSVMSQYSSKDLQKLKSLLLDTVTDPAPVANILDQVSGYLPLANKVFFEYSKDGNPMKESIELAAILGSGGFGAKSPRFVAEVAAYWLFRIRCCVAHNRIGEYVMTLHDEEFVVEFGERLIRAVLLQVFAK